MSFNICRGTLGSLAMLTAKGMPRRGIIVWSTPAAVARPQSQVGNRLAVRVRQDERFLTFLDRPERRKGARRIPVLHLDVIQVSTGERASAIQLAGLGSRNFALLAMFVSRTMRAS
jgi:hypothetical protein